MKTKTLIPLSSILAIIVLAPGCHATPTQHDPSQPQTDQPQTVALVNDAAISQDSLIQLLLPAYGKKVLDEIILLELVRQQATTQGINLTEQMKQDELTRLLNDMAPDKPLNEQMALFNYMLKKRDLTRDIFDLILEKQSLLRRMVNQDVAVTEDMLTEEYQRQHGKCLVVRQIITSSFRGIAEVKKLLNAGTAFPELVRKMSEDQQSLAQDGLSQPFSIADTNIPQPLRDAAFALDHIGQISETFRYTDDKNAEWWCLIKLEKIIPADGVAIASVKEQLAETLRRITISKRMLDLQELLRNKAKITILEPALLKIVWD
jgi:parvulin-like peptidyl-prolyl isomerase